MRNNIQLIIVSIFLLLGLSSCNLDYYPKGEAVWDGDFTEFKFAKESYNAIYLSLRNVNKNDNKLLVDRQSDLINPTVHLEQADKDMFVWDVNMNQSLSIQQYYTSFYAGITDANIFINSLSKLKQTLNGDELQELKVMEGTARAIRGFFFHELTKKFAKAYSLGTKDLGIPLVLTFNPEGEQIQRATLEDTYAQIVSDLDAGLDVAEDFVFKAPNTPDKPDKIYINRDVIRGWRARVALDMKDYEKAISLCDELIAKYPLEKGQEGLEKIYRHDTGSEIVFQMHSTSIDGFSANFGYVEEDFKYLEKDGVVYLKPFFIPSQFAINLFKDDKDARSKVFITNQSNNGNKILITNLSKTKHFPGAYYVSKYYGNKFFDYSPKEPKYGTAIKLFLVSEAYLIKAEAQAFSGEDAEALKTLNVLRDARGAATHLTGDAKEALMEERTREMFLEGVRTYDLKRWGLGLESRAHQKVLGDSAQYLVTYIDLQSKKIEADNKMFVWEFPMQTLQANPNIKPNW